MAREERAGGLKNMAPTLTNNFISSETTAGTMISWNVNTIQGDWYIAGTGNYVTTFGTQIAVKEESGTKGLHSELVFKFIKKKLSILGQYKYEKRIKKLKKLAAKFAASGQEILCRKFLNQLKTEVVLSEVYGAGIKMCISKDMVNSVKHKVRGGHIADTAFDKYSNPVPDDVLVLKKKYEKIKVFDDFVVYHYWNEKLEEKKEKREKDKNVKINTEEKRAMRDPILFGTRTDTPDLLFFIADWDDEYCDLSFDELVDKLPIKDDDVVIGEPKIDL